MRPVLHSKLVRIATLLAVVSACGPIRTKEGRVYPNVDHLTSGDLLETLPLETTSPTGALRDVYPRGLGVTKLSEGWRRFLYNDVANFCTIGYGHLVKKQPCDGSEPERFRSGLSEPVGTELLLADMMNARSTVSAAVATALSDGQYAALCDFVFNVGSTNFRNSSLLTLVNSGRHDELPAQFRRWVLAGGKVQPGLRTRREREIVIYFDGMPQPRRVEGAEQLPLIDIRGGEKRQ